MKSERTWQVWGRVALGACLAGAWAASVAAEPVTICLASDAQVAADESILCQRCDERFYARLQALYDTGWQLKVKLRVRNEQAYAFYLEHPRDTKCGEPQPPAE